MNQIKAEQALSILTVLEGLPVGAYLDVTRCADGEWLVGVRVPARLSSAREHRGETLTDALGQLTTVLALEGGA